MADRLGYSEKLRFRYLTEPKYSLANYTWIFRIVKTRCGDHEP